MAVIVTLKQEHLDAMIAHALADAPVECCGILAAAGGVVAGVYQMRNLDDSPYRFTIHSLEYSRLSEQLTEAGTPDAGIYHSHTGTEARPSPTDVRAMVLFRPPYFHFVIGIADRERPHARVFHIADGTFTEHEYEVVG